MCALGSVQFAYHVLQVRAKEPFTPAMLKEVEQYYFGE